MIYYSSDLHLQHSFVAKLRGFTKIVNGDVTGDAEAHDEVILRNWNSRVRKDDRAYILGDFAMHWKGVQDKLARMNGEKILICGNHDIMSAVHRDGWKHRAEWTGEDLFAAIMDFAKRRTGNHEFLMSHYPYEGDHTEDDRFLQYRLRDYGMWLLHGHTHDKQKAQPQVPRAVLCGSCPQYQGRQIHVGVDAWDLRPVSEPEITALITEQEALFDRSLKLR